MNPENIPKVGIGVMILKDGKVLVSKRKGSHGSGEYAFPGGHLEYMETFEECAIRETREESGIEIKNIRFLYLTNLTKYSPKHYVQIGMIADWQSGEPVVLEKDKTEEWKWFDIDDLMKEKLFETCRIALEAYKTGKYYYL